MTMGPCSLFLTPSHTRQMNRHCLCYRQKEIENTADLEFSPVKHTSSSHSTSPSRRIMGPLLGMNPALQTCSAMKQPGKKPLTQMHLDFGQVPKEFMVLKHL